MSKILVGFFVCILFFSLLGKAKAQETIPTDILPSPSPVEYQLPYPGLLPDNPLYSLKAFRDRIIDFLIADPLKKSEFFLLQADKRLSAGEYLLDKGKSELAQSTISKGENYLEKAVQELKKAKNENIDITSFSGKIVTATKKHQEVLKILANKASKSMKNEFGNLAKRVSQLEKEATSISK